MIESNKHPKANMRLLVIALRGEGKTQPEIAQITHFSTRHITTIITTFSEKGFAALTRNKHSGNNRKVTPKEERRFFKKYKEEAKKGTLITAEEMWKSFCETFETTMTQKAFYKVLARNGWRKIMPKLQHQKVADAKTKRASKKLSQLTESREKRFTWVVDEEKYV
jgi:transposase